jgi:hypothetical protein
LGEEINQIKIKKLKPKQNEKTNPSYIEFWNDGEQITKEKAEELIKTK